MSTAEEIIAGYQRAHRIVHGRDVKRAVGVALALAPAALARPGASQAALRGDIPDRPRTAWDHSLRDRAPTVRGLISAVAHAYDLSEAELLGDNRARSVSRPRQLVMYLARTYTLCSFPEIGRRMAGRDHTTTLWGFKAIESRLADRRPTITADMRLSDLVNAYRQALA